MTKSPIPHEAHAVIPEAPDARSKLELCMPTKKVDPRFARTRLHLNEAAQRELEWFFTMAESDMGLRSNYMEMLKPVAHGCTMGTAEDRLEAAHAQRILRRRILGLGDHEAGVLQAAYTARNWPLTLRVTLGRVTGVVVRIVTADEGLPDDANDLDAAELRVARALDSALVATGGTGLLEAYTRGSAIFGRAFRAYVTARGGGGVPVIQGVSSWAARSPHGAP